MTAYLAEFRGTSSVNDNSEYDIRETAFDFDRFFRSQYLFAPARSDAYYPALTSTFAEAHEKFVIAGVMIHVENPEEATTYENHITVEYEDGREQMFVLSLDEDNTSASRYFPGGAVRKIKARLVSGVTGEYYEAFKMLPKIYDAYALLRVRNIIGGTSADKTASDEYFQHGALFGGEFSDAEKTSPLSDFPPYHSIRRFIKSLARVHSYDRLVGYEVIEEDGVEKSVLYYERDAWQIPNGDMWDNMIHKRKSEASAGGVSEEWVWQIGGSCPASASNPASARIYKEQSYAQIRGAFSNPAFEFDECLQTPLYSSTHEGVADLWTRQRRRNMAFLFRGVPRDDLGIGRYMPWAEAPSGLNYRYETDPNTQGFSSEDQKSYYRANQLFQAPYIIDSIDYITVPEFADAFPNSGRPQGSNATNYIQRGSVSVNGVVKVVLKSRLRRTSTAPATVNNSGTSWNAYSTADRWPAERSKTVGNGILQFLGERSDENRIVELVRHRWQCSTENPPLRLGDLAPSISASPNVPSDIRLLWGNVFCRTFFMKLLPKAYEDGNNAYQVSDTSIFSHLFRHAEMIIRSSCGAFFDVEANRDNNMQKVGSGLNTQCVFKTPPRDFQMESLVSRVDPSPFAVENLPIRYIEDDSVENRRIDGFGPVPNIDFTSGLFNQFSKCINLMVGCTIPGSFSALYSRTGGRGTMCPDTAWENRGLDTHVVEGNGCRYRDILPTGAIVWVVNGSQVWGQLADRTNPQTGVLTPNGWVPIYGPYDETSPGEPARALDPAGFDIGDLDPDYDGEDYQDSWGSPTTGGGSAGASRSWSVGSRDLPGSPIRSDAWKISGGSTIGQWHATGTEEFLEAFAPLMRQYLTRNSLGRPFVEIVVLTISTSLTTETSRSYSGTGGVPYTLEVAHFLPDSFDPMIGKCGISTGATLYAPAVPASSKAWNSSGDRTRVNYTGNNRRTHGGDGGHSSSITHNISAASDATLIINVSGQPIEGIECERTASGLLIPFQWYEVMGGSGIYYAKDGLASAPRDRDEHPEDYDKWEDGAIFFGVRWGTDFHGYTPIRDYEQVDETDPSTVCIRRDLGTAPTT